MVIIIRSFSYEISSIVQSYESYVLKYVDDAVLAFFPSGYYRLLACIKTMITVVGINHIKSISVSRTLKIGLDECEHVIV
jgi:adenylate cyclase